MYARIAEKRGNRLIQIKRISYDIKIKNDSNRIDIEGAIYQPTNVSCI
jgi:hypothetical protein